MTPARTCTALGAALAVAALLAAIGTTWLVMTDPVSLAYAVSEGGTQALIEAVAELIIQAVEQVIGRL